MPRTPETRRSKKKAPPTIKEVGEWAEQLEPDFAGKGLSGDYFVLLSWAEEDGRRFYAVGLGADLEKARQLASGHAANTRWNHVIVPFWA